MNILSIDFDIIMEPMIELYNFQVSMTPFAQLANENPYLNILSINYLHYTKLTDLLFSNLDKEIHFIESHEQIIKYINESSNIINIDHHHDLGYRMNDILPYSVNCSNWVDYLKKNNLLLSYTWITNHNANLTIENDIYVNIKYLQDIQNWKIHLPNIDKIIICLSPEWVPESIQNLYFLWLRQWNLLTQQNIQFEQQEKQYNLTLNQ